MKFMHNYKDLLLVFQDHKSESKQQEKVCDEEALTNVCLVLNQNSEV